MGASFSSYDESVEKLAPLRRSCADSARDAALTTTKRNCFLDARARIGVGRALTEQVHERDCGNRRSVGQRIFPA